MDSMYEIAETW